MLDNMIEILGKLKYHVILIDNRRYLKKIKPKVNCIYSEYKEFAEQFIPANDSVLLPCPGHQFDYDILKTLYQI